MTRIALPIDTPQPPGVAEFARVSHTYDTLHRLARRALCAGDSMIDGQIASPRPEVISSLRS
jgi:predicted kinase